MSTGFRKTTLFYSLLIMVASLAVGMVIASRLDLTPASSAQSSMTAPPMNSAPLSGPVDASTFRNIAKAMSPAVVNIRSTSKQRAQEMTEFFGGGSQEDLLERFFGGGQGQGGQRRRPREQETQSAGTGFVINKTLGYILTNNHVVEDATKIEVGFFGEDGDVFHEAKLIGRDPLTDSALIQLTETKSDLSEVKFGDSSQMQPGDWVVAIGNPFGLGHTVSVGVISATRAGNLPVAQQRFADVLQTDAAINPGNSGGPLLNARGEVIGINTAIYTDARQQGNIGIGFAIPINNVRELIPQLITGKISRGVIGVQVTPVPTDALAEFGLKQRRGALVGTVTRGMPAAKAGIEPGDIILEFNGKAVRNRDELVATVVATKPGTTVPVKILRDKQEKTVSVTVDELNLDAESPRPESRRANNDAAEEESQGFGLTVTSITTENARRLRLPPDVQGVLISEVEQGSPAFRAGLAPGDIITRVNRQEVRTPQDASRLLGQVPSGGTAFLLVVRNGSEQFFTVRKE
ncbi:MAG TPA: Do family serine endopeptidase [Vicinamibacterales bacterium]|nr:Do family serine endopeptidase [Vicinamibacterales bacterium]